MAGSKWSEKLLTKWKDSDVPSQIDELQCVYKKWIIICAVITVGGVVMMMTNDNPRSIAMSLFLAITGMVNIALIKTWVHIKLSMLRVVWALQKEAHSG
jgi:hypothetical protein